MHEKVFIIIRETDETSSTINPDILDKLGPFVRRLNLEGYVVAEPPSKLDNNLGHLNRSLPNLVESICDEEGYKFIQSSAGITFFTVSKDSKLYYVSIVNNNDNYTLRVTESIIHKK